MTLNDILAFLPVIHLVDLGDPAAAGGSVDSQGAQRPDRAFGRRWACWLLWPPPCMQAGQHGELLSTAWWWWMVLPLSWKCSFWSAGWLRSPWRMIICKRMGLAHGEYYTLLLFSVSGMMLMASAHDLIIVFLALELLSIPLYILAGFARPRLNRKKPRSSISCSARFPPGSCAVRHCADLCRHRRTPTCPGL